MEGEQHTSYSDAGATVRIWFGAWGVINIGFLVYGVATSIEGTVIPIVVFAICSLLFGLPALIILLITMSGLAEKQVSYKAKLYSIYLQLFVVSVLYGIFPWLLLGYSTAGWQENFGWPLLFSGGLFIANALSMLLNRRYIRCYAGYYHKPVIQPTQLSHHEKLNTSIMDSNLTHSTEGRSTFANTSNKILIKGIITAALILLMLIPTAFIQSLISERQDRQQQVVEEVSSKWAKPQTVSAPYLVIPYFEHGSPNVRKEVIVLPEQLNVKGGIAEEDRQRSIYKVLLYKTSLNFSGNFNWPGKLPDSSVLIPGEAKICFGVSDFRGIEDKVTVNFGNSPYTLLPGLPSNTIDSTGLSAPVQITAVDLSKPISFSVDVSLRGSGSLHFLPVSSYSSYSINSPWPNPSFDGNTLPQQHEVSGKGFLASWKFNAANLPFTNVIMDNHINTKDIAFGVSLVQPADQYAQSMRSAKYAILIIGLTFVLFFVFELLQKMPVHPVQYALVGIALVIFYTLLVSISEVIVFVYAYSIAAVATILLIALYAISHFGSWRAFFIIALLLTGLYGLIYVLISLEDTALLVGSITLFIVVAIIMYVTRKVRWYQNPTAMVGFQP